MLVLKLESNTESKVTYAYLVESDEARSGKITCDKQSGKAQIVSQAPGDFGKYGGYAAMKVEDLAQKNEYPKEHIVAFG